MTEFTRDGHASHALHGGVYPGNLFMVIAPSGAGKSTLVNALLSKDSDICLSISYTTRKPRPGEQDGQHYHFTTVEDFRARHAAHEFLESAEVHGNHYGTSKQVILDTLESGRDLILEIDWQGARQVRGIYPQCVGIFILPPSVEELERRMRSRGQDADDVIRRRVEAAREELTHAGEFKYAIINKHFETAKQELAEIIGKEQAKPHGQNHR